MRAHCTYIYFTIHFARIYFQLITFQRYEIPGDIDDVVDWDDEGDDDDGAVPDDENIDADNDIEKEKENMDGLGGVSQLCIDVSSDDEQQKEFFDVFHKVCAMAVICR